MKKSPNRLFIDPNALTFERSVYGQLSSFVNLNRHNNRTHKSSDLSKPPKRIKHPQKNQHVQNQSVSKKRTILTTNKRSASNDHQRSTNPTNLTTMSKPT